MRNDESLVSQLRSQGQVRSNDQGFVEGSTGNGLALDEELIDARETGTASAGMEELADQGNGQASAGTWN